MLGFESIGVDGADSLASLGRLVSLFLSSVFTNTLIVDRMALFGLQSAADRGVCSHTAHVEGRVEWPGWRHVSCEVEFKEGN